MAKSVRDSETHTDADSGCARATRYLGRQSSCLECPFDECVKVDGGASRRRGGKIRKRVIKEAP